nr:unnamed protein product [Callosobruchus analis]
MSSSEFVEDIIQEISEREIRKKNLMVFGLAESTAASESNGGDRVAVNNLLGSIGFTAEELSTVKVTRLGKYSANKIRPIKLIMPSEQNVHKAIGSAKKLKGNPLYGKVSIAIHNAKEFKGSGDHREEQVRRRSSSGAREPTDDVSDADKRRTADGGGSGSSTRTGRQGRVSEFQFQG